jgi:O-acetylserine/cysteine efflux transporter
MTPRDIFLAVMIAAIWGYAFVVIRWGVEEMPPLLFTALRFAFSALPAMFFIKPPKTSAALVIAYGFFLGVVKFGLLFSAMKLGMPAGLSSLMMQLQVFFTIALAALLVGERPTRLHWIAGAIALAGVAVIGLSGSGGAPLLPFSMVIVAAFSWGVGNMLAKQAEGVDFLSFIVWASLVPPIPLTLLSLWLDGPDAVAAALLHPSWFGFFCVLFVAWAATLVGFSIWTRLLNAYPAAMVAPFALLVPVFGMVSGWLFLDERFTTGMAAGGALIMAGLAVNVFGPRIGRRLG